jgi:hypothetical protein
MLLAFIVVDNATAGCIITARLQFGSQARGDFVSIIESPVPETDTTKENEKQPEKIRYKYWASKDDKNGEHGSHMYTNKKHLTIRQVGCDDPLVHLYSGWSLLGEVNPSSSDNMLPIGKLKLDDDLVRNAMRRCDNKGCAANEMDDYIKSHGVYSQGAEQVIHKVLGGGGLFTYYLSFALSSIR